MEREEKMEQRDRGRSERGADRYRERRERGTE